MQLYQKDIIEVGSINLVHKYSHKKDAVVFHHITHWEITIDWEIIPK